MIVMTSAQIRQAFLDYFVEKGHQAVASSSLLPKNDPSLLFTNAGMVQFKETFLGNEQRAYSKAVSVQRCVRAGGKHNDLDNVGFTARHHTFFEMLGNFSFGDYFKREAIRYAWEFLTVVLKLPVERLWVTVFEKDDETASIWLDEMGVSAQRFSRCGESDNFWMMGDTGPCGPCTEIFYDHGEAVAGGPPGSPTADGDRYVEIWNLVFMQYNRDKDGHLHPLPKPSVDTGMGLERIAAVVQGVHSNYQIDSFQYLIRAIHAQIPTVDIEHASLKVVADHIRACAFMIADGVIPSNEGQGYVLRRIIRRAVRHGNQLGLQTPFFGSLVKPLIDIMGDAYPELLQLQAQIERVLTQEELQFSRTLEQGLRLLQSEVALLSGTIIPGEMAFRLYDTYGFPIDLTQSLAKEQGLEVDMDGFHDCMAQQRKQSQSSNQFQVDYTASASLDGVLSTFDGYHHHCLSSVIVKLIDNGQFVSQAKKGQQLGVVLQDTPFYAESGGQVGDKGTLSAQGMMFRVDDTQRQGSAVIHYGEVLTGELQQNQIVTAHIDVARRSAIRLNHTATHLLHAALKQRLGEQVQQKGSLVDEQRARFDFSYTESISADTLSVIEQLVNEQIRSNHEVCTTLMSTEDAMQSGATALFGEKYGEQVRVLSMGEFSKELCGGTHATRTGDLGLFKITAEYGVASGVRRIELVTGQAALNWVNEQLNQLTQLANTLKTTRSNVQDKVLQLIQETKQCERERADLQQQLTVQSGHALVKEVETIGDVNVLIKRLDTLDAQGLRAMFDQLKSTIEKAVIVLYAVADGKMSVVVGVAKSLLGRVPNAATFVRHLCGKGGGREDMAQGGSVVPDDLDEKIAQIRKMIQ